MYWSMGTYIMSDVWLPLKDWSHNQHRGAYLWGSRWIKGIPFSLSSKRGWWVQMAGGKTQDSSSQCKSVHSIAVWERPSNTDPCGCYRDAAPLGCGPARWITRAHQNMVHSDLRCSGKDLSAKAQDLHLWWSPSKAYRVSLLKKKIINEQTRQMLQHRWDIQLSMGFASSPGRKAKWIIHVLCGLLPGQRKNAPRCLSNAHNPWHPRIVTLRSLVQLTVSKIRLLARHHVRRNQS